MIEEEGEKYFSAEKLKEKVEIVAGFKMRTPRDFDNLATRILGETKQYLSPTTLKRFWGYINEQATPRHRTLDILSKYVGYIDFDTFCKYLQHGGDNESDFLKNNCLQTKTLHKGAKVKLMWEPNRSLTVQYIDLCMFKVLECKNSKLAVNDIFICERFIENTSLVLCNLIHKNQEPINYICGKRGGIKFQLIEYKERENNGGGELLEF